MVDKTGGAQTCAIGHGEYYGGECPGCADGLGPGQHVEAETLVLELGNGYTMYTVGETYELGAAVRFVDERGLEVVAWDKQEWADAPEWVMGAILGCIIDPRTLVAYKEGKLVK